MPKTGQTAAISVIVTGAGSGGQGDTLAADADDTAAADDSGDTLAVDVGGIFVFVGKSAAEAV